MYLASVLLAWALSTWGCIPVLGYLQRVHYRPFCLPPKRYWVGQILSSLLGVGLYLIWAYVTPVLAYISLYVALSCLPIVALQIGFFRVSPRYTARAIRLWILSGLLLLGLAIPFLLLPNVAVAYPAVAGLGYLVVQLANCILHPIETLRNRHFVKRMSSRLQSSGVTVIGVTGSAGKTSVKRLIAAALGEDCYATPANYNTPMGLALSVQAMPANARYFVAEMGVAQVGDMDELLSFVHPDIGVLTCVLPQHTARFGGVENIRLEKCKLLHAASWSLSLDPLSPAQCRTGEACDYWVENVVLYTDGTCFDIVSIATRLSIRLPLCGRQCAANALAAYLVAHHLGVADSEILARWSHLVPDPHRLCPTRLPSGIVVIDDSYNCNIAGATCALEYLSLYTGRKIVATSGIDESDPTLGLNEQLAAAIDKVADVVVIVGDRYASALKSGLVHAKVYEVANTPASRDLYARLLKSGDTLLVMADYPM